MRCGVGGGAGSVRVVGERDGSSRGLYNDAGNE